jgi:hypothetical protein
MKTPRTSLVPRDQAASQFSAILSRLCDSSGALGASLVDAEGETVDYAGRLNPYDVRVAAAEWRLVLALLEDTRVSAWVSTHEIVVRARGRSFALWLLGEGYAIVLVLPAYAFHVSRRALAEAAIDLAREAGLSGREASERTRWTRVDVITEDRDPRRPKAVWQAGAWCELTIIGRYDSAELDPREVGFMTRFTTGAEVLLVREPLGKWFAGLPA